VAVSVEDVHDQESFLRFVAAMLDELRAGARTWENVELGAFLEAMAAWARDHKGLVETNPWRHAAGLLGAGAFYE
jgi:hypothetical protein